MTKKNLLQELSQEVSVDVIQLVDSLRRSKEYVFADQILRSATSVSANISEANYAQSKADMISKFEIALKEANETENWIIILEKGKDIQVDLLKRIHKKVIKIKIMLIASIKTLKSNA